MSQQIVRTRRAASVATRKGIKGRVASIRVPQTQRALRRGRLASQHRGRYGRSAWSISRPTLIGLLPVLELLLRAPLGTRFPAGIPVTTRGSPPPRQETWYFLRRSLEVDREVKPSTSLDQNPRGGDPRLQRSGRKSHGRCLLHFWLEVAIADELSV
jgi:hypothetical protein